MTQKTYKFFRLLKDSVIPREVNKNLDSFFCGESISRTQIAQFEVMNPNRYSKLRPMDGSQVVFLKEVLSRNNLFWGNQGDFSLLCYRNLSVHNDVPEKIKNKIGLFFHVVLRGTGTLVFPTHKDKPSIELKRGARCLLFDGS